MSTIDASELLRPGLLTGVSIMLAGAPAQRATESLGAGVRRVCAGLGARVCECQLSPEVSLDVEGVGVERVAQEAVERAHAGADSLELLVVDGASVFAQARAAAGAPAAREALRACLDVSWNLTRAVAANCFLPDERGGRIVYLAPSPDAGEHADAARAGLENLARTLSIEWARHGVTAVTIAPGAAGSSTKAAGVAGEVAALTAYLASPAGAYFSGCLLDLRGAAAAAGG